MNQISHLTLHGKLSLGGNIWAFTFEPNVPLIWNAGQAIRVELPHVHPDSAGTKRHFTITSAPFEHIVTITTRLTGSSFKQALATLPTGGRLQLLDPPAGTFAWPRTLGRPVVLVAQGIGITPFISLIRQRRHDRASLVATLIHANLSEPAPFGEELARVAAAYPEFKVYIASQPPTVTGLFELVPGLAAAEVLVSGPRPLFGLLQPPVNLPAARLQYDQFTGYDSSHY